MSYNVDYRKERVTILFTEAEYELLKKNASKYHMTKSEFIRQKALNSKFQSLIK